MSPGQDGVSDRIGRRRLPGSRSPSASSWESRLRLEWLEASPPPHRRISSRQPRYSRIGAMLLPCHPPSSASPFQASSPFLCDIVVHRSTRWVGQIVSCPVIELSRATYPMFVDLP